MIEVEPGIYEYEYYTLLDSLTQLKICVSDTDREIELELPEITVGTHKHIYVNGICSCGAKDPNYVEHEHEFVDGECECGEIDPDYEEHEHEFVKGECECGAKDPDYKEPSTGGSNCPMGFVSLLPMLAAATLLLIRKKR